MALVFSFSTRNYGCTVREKSAHTRKGGVIQNAERRLTSHFFKPITVEKYGIYAE